MLGEEPLTEVLDRGLLRVADRLANERRGFLEIVGKCLPNDLGGTVYGRVLGGRCMMKMDKPLGEEMDPFLGDSSGGDQRVQGALRREATHPHQIIHHSGILHVDGFPNPVRLTRVQDRHDPEIDRRREAAIEPHFLLATVVPQRERGVVKKGKTDGFLELIDHLPSEKHDRDVRLYHLDVSGVMRVARWLAQRRQEVSKRGSSWGAVRGIGGTHEHILLLFAGEGIREPTSRAEECASRSQYRYTSLGDWGPGPRPAGAGVSPAGAASLSWCGTLVLRCPA